MISDREFRVLDDCLNAKSVDEVEKIIDSAKDRDETSGIAWLFSDQLAISREFDHVLEEFQKYLEIFGEKMARQRGEKQ